MVNHGLRERPTTMKALAEAQFEFATVHSSRSDQAGDAVRFLGDNAVFMG